MVRSDINPFGGIISQSVVGGGVETKKDEIAVDHIEGEGSVIGEEAILLED